VNPPPSLRILALMEAASVTGPAKNLIGFSKWLQSESGIATGLQLAIVTFDRNARTDQPGSFAWAAREAGIETHVIHERYRFDWGVVSQLRDVVAAVEPHIIQTHNSKSHFLLWSQPSLRTQRRWFAFEHGHVHADLKVRLYNTVDRLTLRSADRIISVCQAFAARLIRTGIDSRRIRVLHNAATPVPQVSTADRAELRKHLRITDDQAVLLTIGRLSREKGHEDLLRAAVGLRFERPDWKLVVVGDGPERAHLEALARSLQLESRVRFVGFQQDASRYYSIADVFILPSRSEGSSNVLLEAMMAQVPIVATMAGGNAEIVVHGQTGLIAGIGNSKELAEGIERLLQQPEFAQRLKVAAYARACQEFSAERYRQRLLSYYTEAESGQVAAVQADGGT